MESGQTNLYRAAKIISTVGHPFVVLSVTILAAALQNASPARALRIVGITLGGVFLPLLLIIRHRVAAGKWSDADVSIQRERGGFYAVLISVVAFSCAAFWLLGFPRSFLLGTLVTLALLAAAALINRFSKISLHMIFAAYCTVLMGVVSLGLGASFALLTAAVGWSRVVLQRHNPAQVLSGAALGATAGICLLKLLGVI